MSIGGDTACVGKKPPRRVSGMSNALNIADDLGFSVGHGDIQNDSGNGLVRILKELSAVQRKIANLEVELQGRNEEKNVAHLTRVTEMENKTHVLARLIAILEDVIRHKDRVIARLQQQPFYLDCVPVEAEYQKQFSELLMMAGSDNDVLTDSECDFKWIREFNEPPTVWREMLHPIRGALASCARLFEAVTATRESFAKLQALRVDQSSQTMRSESSFDDLAVGSMRKLGSERHGRIEEGSENGD